MWPIPCHQDLEHKSQRQMAFPLFAVTTFAYHSPSWLFHPQSQMFWLRLFMQTLLTRIWDSVSLSLLGFCWENSSSIVMSLLVFSLQYTYYNRDLLKLIHFHTGSLQREKLILRKLDWQGHVALHRLRCLKASVFLFVKWMICNQWCTWSFSTLPFHSI